MNKNTRCSQSRKAARGFTLLEVLVASALFLVILAILLGVMNSTTLIASDASRRIEASRIARESLDLMGRDLTGATLPWARDKTNSLQFVVNPAGNVFANRDALFWQAPIVRESTNNTGGDLAVVGYFVLRDLQANAAESRFQLRRVYVDPKSSDYQVYGTNSTTWLPDLTQFAPPASADKTNAQKGWVADGVLGMWVRCFDRSGNVLPNSTNFDSRAPLFGQTNAMTNSYPSTKVVNYGGRSFTNTFAYSRLPASVEVTLVCVAPRDRLRIKTLPSSTNVTTYAEQVRALNPGVKSVNSFSRKFQLLTSD